MKPSSEIRIAFKGLPKEGEINFIDVPTYQNFVITSQLGSGPFHSFGDFCENVYLADFETSPDFRDFRLVFKDDCFFSSGMPLRAKHFYNSVLRLIRFGKGVHFNPRRDLEGADLSPDGICEGLRLNENEVRLRLKRPNRRLPALLGKIEAAILPLESADLDHGVSPRVSAGPFVLESFDAGRILMRRNPHYPVSGSIEALSFHETTDTQAIDGLLAGQFDCCLFSPHLDRKDEERIQNSSLKKLRFFGQTYFLSQRNSAISADKVKALAGIVHEMEVPPPYLEAKTILLGDGLGRISNDEIKSPARNPSQKIDFSFSVAAVDSTITKSFVENLERHGIRPQMIWVKTFPELYRGDALKADFILAHNDFAGTNPHIAFYNSLNPDRPLIFDDKNLSWRSKLLEIESLDSRDSKDVAYRNLHKEILQSYRVIPYASRWDQFLSVPELELFQEAPFALWKARFR